MKKLFITFAVFVVLALAVEVAVLITGIAVKWDSFANGRPIAVIAHAHLMALGALVFLILTLLEKSFGITSHKLFKPFYVIYLTGVGLTAFVMIFRGFTQLAGAALIKPVSDAGYAIGHTLTFAALFILIKILYDKIVCCKKCTAEIPVDKKEAETPSSEA